MLPFLLEVIAFNANSCVIAENAGAHRIELCDNPMAGGTTPSYGTIKLARRLTRLPLYPIIRPRDGDFLYSNIEFETMLADVKLCKQLGCDGVVLGLLDADGNIDKQRTALLVEAAYPMGATFHRAFDRCRNPFEALEDIIDCGCERILTSGQQTTATDGAALIASLVQKAQERIIVMPGSGIRAANIREIATRTGAREFHSSARSLSASGMKYKSSTMAEDLQHTIIDEKEVKLLSQALHEM